MVRIRMKRLGRTHRPFYRIGVADARESRSGTFIEQLGWYDPIARDPGKQLSLKPERIQHWLSKGAQPSDTVRDIFGREGLLPAEMKAQWERDREIARNRVECKKGASEIEGMFATFEKLDAGEADPAPYKKRVADALKQGKRGVSKASIDVVTKAQQDATSAIADLEKAIASAKPAEEPAKGE